MKLNLTYIILLLIIILSLIYVINQNIIENKQLENFINRNSLSSYYKNKVDEDSLIKNINKDKMNQISDNIINKESKWNGIWSYQDDILGNCMCVILQINKHIVFSLSKKDFIFYSNNENRSLDSLVIEESKTNCPLNTFIGVGELNNDDNLFYLKSIYCDNNNTFKLNDVNIKINHLTGKFRDDNSIVLTIFNDLNDINKKNIYLNKSDELKYNSSAAYLLYSSYNVPLPILKDELKMNHDICSNSYFDNQKNLNKCYIKGSGLPYLKDDKERSSYGTGCSTDVNKDENDNPICSSNIKNTCFLPINNTTDIKDWSGKNYKQCNTDFKVELKNETSILQPIYEKNNGVLNLCKQLTHFQDGRFNTAIIMYVDDLYNVQTLSYNFFGVQDNQSALTTEYDIMFSFMNEYILKKYRDALVDGNTNNTLLENSLNLTNCLNSNDSKENYQKLLNSCLNKYSNSNNQLAEMIKTLNKKDLGVFDIEKLIDNKNKLNKMIMPTMWNLEFNNPTDYTDSCSFTLSSSSLYEKESQFVKYPEFYPMKQKTKMNLYKGSNNQKLVLENANIIDSIDNYLIPSEDGENISNEFIIISGNLRTYQPKKYLLPSNESDISNPFGNEIYLSDRLKSNGKWVIMGLNLNKNNLLEKNNNIFIKTLKKIKNTINSN